MNATPWRKSSRSGGNGQGSQCVEARALWRKSSRSNGNATNSQCVEARALWRKSSRSGGNGHGSACVEARALTGAFQLRDSKLGDTGPLLTMSPIDYTALLHTIDR